MTRLFESDNTGWRHLYRIAGISAFFMALFIPIQIVIFVLYPPPTTVLGWFELFQQNYLIGLFDLDLLLIIDQLIVGLIMLAMFVTLRHINKSVMLIALMFSMLGIAAYFASTIAFEMLSLSNKYALATSEDQRTILLTSGEVMLANWQGTAFSMGYIIEGIALLLVAYVMLKSEVFSRSASIIAIILGVMSLIPPTAGPIGMFFALGSLIPLEIWTIIVGLKFLRLAKVPDYI